MSEHRTEEGIDLLPVKKTIAFDCPHDERVQSKDDIFISIKGQIKCPEANFYIARPQG
jgi:hypothetical protein